uniref:Uncharacterized protein n=1 Tax=Oryza brachyantha TaxID=4533 RepID=J3MGV6_ORYBR
MAGYYQLVSFGITTSHDKESSKRYRYHMVLGDTEWYHMSKWYHIMSTYINRRYQYVSDGDGDSEPSFDTK